MLVAVALAASAALPATTSEDAKGKGAGAPRGIFAKAHAFFQVGCPAHAHANVKVAQRIPKHGHACRPSQAFGRAKNNYPRMGELNPANFMANYDGMHKWFCGQEANKAKDVCTSGSPAKGPHPLFNPKHKHRADYLAMAKGYPPASPNMRPALHGAPRRAADILARMTRDRARSWCQQPGKATSDIICIAFPAAGGGLAGRLV